MSYTREEMDSYFIIMRCLESAPYAGKEFQAKCFRFLDENNDKKLSFEQRMEGWQKLHEEYERLSEPHWKRVFERIANRQIKQRELFA